MPSNRYQRLQSAIQELIPGILLSEIDEFRFGIITVTGVKVLGDTTEVIVFVSAIKNREALLPAIIERIFFIQGTFQKALKGKAPRLRFELDKTSGNIL